MSGRFGPPLDAPRPPGWGGRRRVLLGGRGLRGKCLICGSGRRQLGPDVRVGLTVPLVLGDGAADTNYTRLPLRGSGPDCRCTPPSYVDRSTVGTVEGRDLHVPFEHHFALYAEAGASRTSLPGLEFAWAAHEE
jgi:hypothetical protein